MKQVACIGLILVLSVDPGLIAQSSDPEVEKGIRLVEQGEYSRAIIVLDAAARRLDQRPQGKGLAARAYLHLGIAYVAEGQESLARASLREALVHDPRLDLSAFEVSPKVRELFQQVKNEMAQQKEPAKKGGSKAPLILLGLAGVGGAAAALVAGGGPAPSPSPSPRGLQGPRDIVLLSADPPSGSTISLGSGGVVVRVVVTAVFDQPGSFFLFAADLHDGGTGRQCICGQTPRMEFTPGQPITSEIDLQYPCTTGLFKSCPNLPYQSTGLAVALNAPGPVFQMDRNFAVIYMFKP